MEFAFLLAGTLVAFWFVYHVGTDRGYDNGWNAARRATNVAVEHCQQCTKLVVNKITLPN